nr:hypothetical protein [Pseudarthrobacter sulfonivorans]
MDLNNNHVRRQPLGDGFGQRGLANAGARHQEHCLAGSAPDNVADPIQRLPPSREQAARFR